MSSAAQAVASVLREEIANGTLPAGSLLPPEQALIKRFGISRPICREALRILQSEELLRVRRGNQGGAVVQPPNPNRIADYASVFLRMRGAILPEIYEARLLIEPPIVASLAENPDPVMLTRLAQIAASQRWLIDDIPRYFEANRDFRRTLIEYCPNETLRLLGLVIGQISDVELARQAATIQLSQEQREHLLAMPRHKLALVEAISDKDPAAASLNWRIYVGHYLRQEKSRSMS